MKELHLVKKSLALRLLKVVFSIYLCITIIITVVQMTNEYLLEEKFVKDSLVVSQNIAQESLATSIWNFDREQLAATIHGILKQPMIVGIEIVDENNTVLIKNGEVLNKEINPVLLTDNGEVPLNYISLFPHEFTLLHNNKIIGKVIFYSSNQVVFNKVKYNFLFIIISSIIKTITLWLLFLWAFNRFLTRQLDIFCQAMEDIDIDRQKNCFLQLETFDTYELSRIEYFFNDLLKRIIDSRDKLNILNKTLEEKVVERTLQLEKLAITDELTQLYNRRYFNNIFPKEIQRAARKQQTISFLIFDIDNFKQYNDNYGHQQGDEVLKTIGQILKIHCLRASDIALRLGGEEFGVIFSHLNAEEALIFANTIKQAIEAAHIVHAFSSASDIVTASFGLVTQSAHSELNMDELYKQADNALYQAKNKGRNRVETSQGNIRL